MSQKGFTLFEMIVSLGIFSMAMLIMLGSLLSITGAQKKAVSLSTTEDNLRFAIDAVSKEIRTGYTYDCGNTGGRSNCASGGTIFTFNPGRTGITKVIYRWNQDEGSIERSVDGGAKYYALTGRDVKITRFKFFVTGALSNDNLQPQVTILLQAETGADQVRSKSVFNIQTTVAQRQIDS